MSKIWMKIKPLLPPLMQYMKIIALIGFLFFVIVFWYTYILETSWGLNRLAGWWIYLITITIFLPWEIIWGLRKTKIYPRIKNEFGERKQDFLHTKNNIVSALTEKDFLKRLRNASLAIIVFMIFAEVYVVREFSTTSQIENIWRITSSTVKVAFNNTVNYLSAISGIRTSYEFRGFVFYIIGLIVLRQGIRYVFSNWVTIIESNVIQKLEDIYSQPNKTKLLAYALLTLIALVFISYVLGQGSYSLIIESPLEKGGASRTSNSIPIIYPFGKEGVISAKLVIQDFDVKNSKVTGMLTLTENKHEYNEGGCYEEDYFTTVCEDPSGFPPVFYNEKNIIVNGKELSVSTESDKAIVVDSNFSDQTSGNDYFFPFNEYTSKITVSSDKFWDYAAISINTNHRFFSIHQEQYLNNFSYTNGTFYFKMGYAPYYKILVFVIFFALFSFLWVIWHTGERETLIELSLGVFATIITMRGFLIPQDFSTDPIFLDQVLLVYIALFLFILLYKHEVIKGQSSA
jgi:hypothetical protein